MVDKSSGDCREISASISKENPGKTVREFNKIKSLNLSSVHSVQMTDIKPKNFKKILEKTYERRPQDFEQLLGMEGVGPKTIRALSLISELVYGKPAAFEDPVRFSFAHGGKDGHPYPVNRK